MSGNRNNSKSSKNSSKDGKDSKQIKTDSSSTDSLLSFLSTASNAMRKAMDMTKQGSSANSRKRDPNHRRHLLNNMKESSLEYSAYNKRRYKRRSISSSSAHNGDAQADSSDYLTDTMKELFMNSTEEPGTNLHFQSSNQMEGSLLGYTGDSVYFQENEWAADCESIVTTSDHYFNASNELQLSQNYEGSYMGVPQVTGYIPDPFEGGSNFTNSSSYLTSSLEMSEIGGHLSDSFNLETLCRDNLVSSQVSCSSCLYNDKATGLPNENGNTNNNNLSRKTELSICVAPEALASGEFSSVDTRLVEQVLAQADIQATMNELVDIARPKRKRVSVTPTHENNDQMLPYSIAYQDCQLSHRQCRQPLTEIRPKSWATSRPSHQHKLAHKRQSCPNSSPSYTPHTTGLSPYQGGFFSNGPPHEIGLI
ncbi:hypothetical protein LOD99_15014 [Oopsacas minuta]|uniref:Uncharacterized protein n=1 Tax=Oopsacas minuta TaxID=111878 RepID=A0AAV7KDQ6_9METZ|nr:hypothetical protein LOD99_15014 [Oopsacas minuta]